LSNRRAVFLYSDQLEKYPYPPELPFKTDRPLQLRKTLASIGLLGGPDRKVVSFEPADQSELKLLHTQRYIDTLIKSGRGEWGISALGMGIGGPDTPVFPVMYEHGALVTGATLRGADLLLAGEADVAFNPAGGLHHAGPERAAGFCYINDVAIACLYLVQKGQRVLYLDVDVHHGDGVQNACYDRNDVMTISMHESGRYLFPGTGFVDEIGVGEGYGHAVNIPFPPETYNEAYLKCFDEIVVPLTRAYDFDIIVFELGADALAGDPLAHLKLTNRVYAKILDHLLQLGKPLLMTGGGGYHIENTVRAWSLAWSVITGEDKSDMHLGLGGVMLESTDWVGGFRDRVLPVTEEQKSAVDPVIDETIRQIKQNLFPIHGLEI
jgi:acetoin utilization protein AcuC